MIYPDLEDLQLVSLLKKGDGKALAEIYRRYAETLTAFTSARLFATEEALDIIHDIFVKIWEDRHQLNIDRNLKAYLFTITRFKIVDKIRKNIHRKEYAALVQALTRYSSGTEELIAVKELDQIIQKSLNELSPRVKEIYQLSREEELSISEIAEKLQISEQTVKNQLTTALKHLRQSIPVLSAAVLFGWLQ